MQEEHVRQREDSDFHLSHLLKNERWKHFNSCCLNLNITLPKQVSNVVTTIVEKQSIRQAVTVFICNLLSIKGEFTLHTVGDILHYQRFITNEASLM